MRILFYPSEEVFNRPNVVKRLKFLTNGGWGRHPEGSAMLEDIESKRKGWAFLAWENGEIIGWAFATQRRDNKFQVGIYVSSKYRRRGVGTKLALKVKNFASEYDSCVVSRGWTTAGLKMYEKVKIPHEVRWEYY